MNFNLITAEQREELYKREHDKNKTLYSVRLNGRYGSVNAMLPIYTSQVNIERAYRIINTVIRVLEDMEASVSARYDFDPNRDIGTFNIMNISFNFELTEVIKK